MMKDILVAKAQLKKTICDKILKDRAYNIAINPKYDGYQKGLASVVYKFFDKKQDRERI